MGTLGQPGQRADQVGGDAAVGAGVGEHLLRVPVGVVVGEDRAVEIFLAARDLEVMGGGADRVDRVVGILAPVAVGVQPVRCQLEGRNCIQPSAPALEMFRLVPKPVSILLIAASTSQGMPYSVPQAW